MPLVTTRTFGSGFKVLVSHEACHMITLDDYSIETRFV